jgi:transketolase
MIEKEIIKQTKLLASKIRIKSLEMAFNAGKNGAHLGGALSLAEIFAVLYGCILSVNPRNPNDPERDRLVVSKGHCVLSYYAALNEAGFISDEELTRFETNGSMLHGHATRNLSLGIEFSGGSLGMGVSFAIGVALAGKMNHKPYHVNIIAGDGECNEGIVWEAFMSAAHFKLDNLTVIIDHNKFQYDGDLKTIMDMGSLKTKLDAFGFHSIEVDGHHVSEIIEAFQNHVSGKPLAIIANTIKGKGVSFMENRKEWHHGILSKELYEKAMAEQPTLQKYL